MDNTRGVPMICATSVMKPGRARIGRISKDITLPRTVPIVNLVAAGVGAFLGLWLAFAIGSGAQSVAIGMGAGAFAGWMAVTYSPLKNESLLKWFELKVKSQTRTRYINGRRVTLAVGTAVVDGPSSGEVMLLRSAVRVPAGQYDERGAVRSARNLNLDSGTVDPALTPQSWTAPEGANLLPTDAPVTRRSLRTGTPATSPVSGPARAPQPPNAAPQPAGLPDPLAGPSQRLKD